MKIPYLKALIALLGLLCSAAALAQQTLIPAPPEIAASSYILLDTESGRVIVEHNSDERLPPASLTKMMTAYITERELDQGRASMDDPVMISVNAWRTGGSRMFVREGTTVRLEDLLKGIIIQSGNDASVAVAEHIAGSESAFADIMNQQAQLLGMNNTRFQNATGLPAEEHYSSARDLAILAMRTIKDFPQNYPLYAQKYFTYADIRQPNRNSLLWRDDSVDGLKTGHTEEAGYCLVASAKRDDMRLVAVVMGTSSEKARAQEVQKLLNYGFRYYETHRLFAAGQKLMDSRVWGGTAEEFGLGLNEAVHVTIPRGAKPELQSSLDVDAVIEAPVTAGESYGTVKVKLGETVLVDKPLLALQSVEEAGLFKQLWDKVKLFFTQLFS